MVRLLDYKPSALAIELQELKSYCWEGVEFIQLVCCIIIYLYSIYYMYTSLMRSQSQLRNDKYIMMQYTNWINSFPAIVFELL